MGKTKAKRDGEVTCKAAHWAEYFFPKFEKLAVLYKEVFLGPSVRACGGKEQLLTSRWESLGFFLLYYAFERQGRSPDYAPVAFHTVGEMKDRALDPKSSKNVANEVWRKFADKLEGKKLNHMNNPVCPKDIQYTLRNGGKRCTPKLSAVQLAAAEQLQGKSLVMWSRKLLEENKVKEAYDALRQINGVGVKIARLFLRDVATMYGIAPKQFREYLQPIDTWVKFVVGQLAEKAKTDTAKATFIVEQAQEGPDRNQPEEVNQGMWYFCAQVAGSSKYSVRRSLEDTQFFDCLVTRHVDRLVANGKAASRFTWK